MGIKTLVLGLGNTLMGDEGVGVHTLKFLDKFLQDTLPLQNDIELLDGGTLSFSLAVPLADSEQLIVIDAAQLDSAPGTVRVFEGEEMDRFVGQGKKSSVHEVGLFDLLAISRLSEKTPNQRALIGIQPETIDWADNPTPAVAQAIPVASAMVCDLIRRWRQL